MVKILSESGHSLAAMSSTVLLSFPAQCAECIFNQSRLAPIAATFVQSLLIHSLKPFFLKRQHKEFHKIYIFLPSIFFLYLLLSNWAWPSPPLPPLPQPIISHIRKFLHLYLPSICNCRAFNISMPAAFLVPIKNRLSKLECSRKFTT